jgi:uncharacterized protein YndB with AHSA1/START domain
MSDQSYTTSFTVDRTPDEVFAAINDVRAWWNTGIQGDASAVGDEFVHEVPDVHWSRIRVTEVVPGETVVWRVIDNRFGFIEDDSEWIDTEIRFELSEQDGSTDVRFTHAGLVPEDECFEACSDGWSFYIRSSLRSLITTGEGTPNTNPDEARYQDEARVREGVAEA